MFEYIIWAPPYTPASAGVWVLHKLCHDLRAAGRAASVVSDRVNPQFDTPAVDPQTAASKARDGHVVVVYPEVVRGNPLGASNVVRYLLNSPRHTGGQLRAGPREFVLSFSRVFNFPGREPDHVLLVPHVDDTVFYDRGVARRSLSCYYVGKSKDPARLDHRGHVELPRGRSLTLRQLADVFNASLAFYCYDNMSVMANLAVFCGCPAVIIPDGTFSRSEWARTEWGLDGVAWGPEELGRARATVGLGRMWYETAKAKYPKALAGFVAKTQAWAAGARPTPATGGAAGDP